MADPWLRFDKIIGFGFDDRFVGASRSMANQRADQNLLFGILALQMNFITRDALIEEMHAWILDKEKMIGV